ncbi:MAG: 3-deoxy-manno-octulosonate cytidylyltransferase [Myxococcaceae bacterium]
MSNPDRIVAVIPSRYASSRFPGKPLAVLAGKPMVQHVWERCVASGAFTRVGVATDDARIADVVRGFGGEVWMTSPTCATGTDRVAEVAGGPAADADVLVNVQGDEPLISPEALRARVGAFEDASVEMATLVRPLAPEEVANPNVVKAVLGLSGDALYFSRAPVPFERDPDPATGPTPRWAHLGLYGYRRATLLRLAALPPSPLEGVEKLEQLRALENGIRIRCRVTHWRSVGVDVPADLLRAEEALRQGP